MAKAKKENPGEKGGGVSARQEVRAFREKLEDLNARGYVPLIPTRVGEVQNGVPTSETMLSMGGSIGGAPIQGTFGMFDDKQSRPEPVEGVGTPGLGYIPWGPGNMMPNLIYNLASSTPYTASPLKYLIDLTVGYGPALMYAFTRVSNGAVVRDLIPYNDAGPLLLDRIKEVRKVLREERQQEPEPGSTVSWNAAKESKSEPGTLQYELEELLHDYSEWQRTKAEVDEFLEKNNLLLHYTKCMTDDAHMDIYFPMVGLSIGRDTGKWEPKIISVDFRPTLCIRFEQMDSRMRINHVYYSEKWRKDTTPDFEGKKPVAYPTLMPENFLTELRRKVEEGQNKSPRRRATWFCCPSYTPSMMKPYYPQPAWWSIFPSKLYEYITTLITDRAVARKNATMWGKIIYINQDYLERCYNEYGLDNQEEQEKFKQGIFNDINQFLKRRENNGKTISVDRFLPSGMNQYVNAIEIVDVPTVSLKEADHEELTELMRTISFGFGLNAEMVGSVPTETNGGTYQRELHLMKQSQQSVRQRMYLRFLQNIQVFNKWDKKGIWGIQQPAFTTLDRNPRGVEESATI